jgi:hypothetical protein
MPRKKKNKDEKERIIEKPSVSQEESNSLEQRIEIDEEKVDFSELKEFLEEPRSRRTKTSPSLDKINAPQRNPTRLERNLTETSANTGTLTNGEEDNGLNYIPKIGGAGEPKYIAQYGGMIEEMTPRTEIPNMGKGRPLERREVGFESSAQSRIGTQENFEKYIPVKKVDKDNLGKENPFQRKEVKYTPGKY